MKKVLSAIMVFVMVLFVFPAGSIMSSALTSGVYTYTVTDSKATITAYSGTGGVINIPAELGGYSVTDIGSQVFLNNTAITSVVIPNSVTTIGSSAFWGCSGMTDLVFGTNVTAIGSGAFLNCTHLTSLNLPDSLTVIGSTAFQGCDGLTEVVIPNSVTTINGGAFVYSDGLTTVTIGDHVSSIGNNAFKNCTSLASAYFLGNAPTLGNTVFLGCASGFTVFYLSGKTGFISPWYGYLTEIPGYSTIVFNANGGIGGTSNPMLPGLALTAPVITKAGYTFTGWSPLVPATVPQKSTTYKAQWAASTFTVTFDAQGGTVTPSSITVIYLNSYGTLPTPSRTDYVFSGWYTSPGGAGTRVYATNYVSITSAQTLYAKWIPVTVFTVTFDPQGGTVSPATITVTTGLTYGTLPEPTKSGKVFSGWYTGTDGSGTCIYSTTMVTITSDQTLYAKWSNPRYHLDFDENGGSGGMVLDYLIPAGTMVTITTFPQFKVSLQSPDPLNDPIYVPDVMLELPTRPGYTFLGWSMGSFIMPAHDVTVSAIWSPTSPATVMIIFDANGGEGDTRTEMTPGGPLTAPDVSREGYYFIGWAPSVPTTVPGNSATYTAEWQINSYIITFDANGGTGSTNSLMHYGETITPPTVSRAGYIFTGWDQAVSATVGADNATYTALWSMIGDLNTDVNIDSLDALMLLRSASGKITLTDAQKLVADINKDSETDSLDALMILRFASGKIISF